MSGDIYFSEDLSGGHSLCLNEENMNECAKKITSEMENTHFLFYVKYSRAPYPPLSPGAVLTVSFRIDYL